MGGLQGRAPIGPIHTRQNIAPLRHHEESPRATGGSQVRRGEGSAALAAFHVNGYVDVIGNHIGALAVAVHSE